MQWGKVFSYIYFFLKIIVDNFKKLVFHSKIIKKFNYKNLIMTKNNLQVGNYKEERPQQKR